MKRLALILALVAALFALDVAPASAGGCVLRQPGAGDVMKCGPAQFDSITTSGTLTTTGTLSAEQLTSTDDATITDDLNVGGAAIVTGNITTTAGTVSAEQLTSTDDSSLGDDNTDLTTVTGKLLTAGTAPTPSSCGTTPAVVGSDAAGKITVGSSASAVDGCVLTFSVAYAAAPVCQVIGDDSAMNLAATTSTTALTITSTAAGDPSGDVWMYLCVGQDGD